MFNLNESEFRNNVHNHAIEVFDYVDFEYKPTLVLNPPPPLTQNYHDLYL